MDDDVRKVDVNQADIEELTQLPGIAENLARRIIEYRETVHPFEEVMELTAVPGISERMVREFADLVTVQPVAMMERTVSVPALALEAAAEVATEETVAADAAAEVESEPDLDIEPLPVPDEDEVPEPEAALAEVMAEVEEATAEAEEVVESQPVATETTPSQAVEEMETVVETAEPLPVYEDDRPEPEPVIARTTEAPPPPRPGRVLGQILLGSILGAFVGALLTLAILAVINNGTLAFTQADAGLRGEINDARQSQNDLSQTVENLDSELNSNLGHVATRTGELHLQQAAADQSLQEMSAALRTVQAEVDDLAEMAASLDERLTTVAAAAETFDTFLDGLRDLLVGLQGEPEMTSTPAAAVEGTATITATPEEDNGATVTATRRATAVPTSTSRPTRTPRPTATPIPLSTSTPSQQP